MCAQGTCKPNLANKTVFVLTNRLNMTLIVLTMPKIPNTNNLLFHAVSLLQFLFVCMSVIATVPLSSFVPHLFFFWCLRSAVLRDFDLYWVTSLGRTSPKRVFGHKRTIKVQTRLCEQPLLAQYTTFISCPLGSLGLLWYL